MNCTPRLIRGLGLFLLGAFAASAACLYFDVPMLLENRLAAKEASFICPMHADIAQKNPGTCPKCGMALVPAGQVNGAQHECAGDGQHHDGCCENKHSAKLQLPPGHPAIPGFTRAEDVTNAIPTATP